MTANPPIGPDHQLPSPAEPKHSSMLFKVVLWIVILLVFGGGLWWVLRQHDATQDAGASSKHGGAGGPITITEATAETGDIGQYIEGIGTVTPVYTVSITSQVGGAITKVYYDEGQLVKQGEPLIDIDSRSYAATLLQAQGALERDQNLLGQAKMDLERYQIAWSKNAIQKQILDDQEKLVLQDEGTVKNDQGLVNYDQVQVDYCHITAPIAGRVGLRLVDQGNVVQANGNVALAVLTQVSPITVVFTMPEDSIDLVMAHLHGPKKLTVDAFDHAGAKKIASGTLLALDNQIDTTTGTVKARALFPNTDGKLFPNQFVNVRLLVNTFEDVTLIPSSAIQHNGSISFVYTIDDDDIAHMQNVTTGVTENGMTQVTGIDEDDVVANSGFEKLQDKAKVVLAKAPSTSPTTGPTTGPATAPASPRSEAP